MREIPDQLAQKCLDLAYIHIGDGDELGVLAREIIKALEEKGVVASA